MIQEFSGPGAVRSLDFKIFLVRRGAGADRLWSVGLWNN